MVQLAEVSEHVGVAVSAALFSKPTTIVVQRRSVAVVILSAIVSINHHHFSALLPTTTSVSTLSDHLSYCPADRLITCSVMTLDQPSNDPVTHHSAVCAANERTQPTQSHGTLFAPVRSHFTITNLAHLTRPLSSWTC